MNESLNPCPFCGKSEAFVERADFSSCYAVCNNCSARGPMECQESDDEDVPGEATAKRSWNIRAHSAEEVERSDLGRLRKLEAVVEAARCIRHWHDSMKDGSGMVVSAEHVRILWDKLSDLDSPSAVAHSADAGGAEHPTADCEGCNKPGCTCGLTGPCKGGACWRNPETGYLEACPEHQSQGMDLMFEAERRRDKETIKSQSAELKEAREIIEELEEIRAGRKRVFPDFYRVSQFLARNQ